MKWIFLASMAMMVLLVSIVLVGFYKQNAVEVILSKDGVIHRIPFEYTSSGHLKVIAELDTGELFPLILDTGASSILFEDFVSQTDARLDWIMPSLDANLVPSIGRTYRLNEISLGDHLVFRNPSFKMKGEFLRECDNDVKGILGVNLMKDLKWRINFDEKEIEIAKDISLFSTTNPLDTIRLVQNAYSHHVRAFFTLSADSVVVKKRLLIDTGYNGYITMSKPDNVQKIFTDSILFKGMTTRGINSEKPNEAIYLANNFKIDNTSFNPIPVNARGRSLNALGLGFFGEFTSMILDWENSVLLLENKESEPRFLIQSFGVSFRFEDDRCYFKAAIANRVPDMTKYLDNQVLAINGIQVKNQLELCQLNLEQAEKLELEILSRDNKVVAVVIEKKPLFGN